MSNYSEELNEFVASLNREAEEPIPNQPGPEDCPSCGGTGIDDETGLDCDTCDGSGKERYEQVEEVPPGVEREKTREFRKSPSYRWADKEGHGTFELHVHDPVDPEQTIEGPDHEIDFLPEEGEMVECPDCHGNSPEWEDNVCRTCHSNGWIKKAGRETPDDPMDPRWDECEIVPDNGGPHGDGKDYNGDQWNRCITHDQLVFGDSPYCEGHREPKYKASTGHKDSNPHVHDPFDDTDEKPTIPVPRSKTELLNHIQQHHQATAEEIRREFDKRDMGDTGLLRPDASMSDLRGDHINLHDWEEAYTWDPNTMMPFHDPHNVESTHWHPGIDHFDQRDYLDDADDDIAINGESPEEWGKKTFGTKRFFELPERPKPTSKWAASLNFAHVVKEFQRWNKDQQLAHLKETHGVEIEKSPPRKGANPLYQAHVTAHSDPKMFDKDSSALQAPEGATTGILYGDDGDTYQTTDGGETWNKVGHVGDDDGKHHHNDLNEWDDEVEKTLPECPDCAAPMGEQHEADCPRIPESHAPDCPYRHSGECQCGRSEIWKGSHVHASKFAMANRSGHPELDKTIEDFLKEPMGDWTTDDRPISTLSDPHEAHGNCHSVAKQFADFAKKRGFNAYATDTDTDEMGYHPHGKPGGDILDKDGNIKRGFYHDHTVNEVYLPGRNFPVTIDFTASQYGYKDHPKVLSKTAAKYYRQKGHKIYHEVNPETGKTWCGRNVLDTGHTRDDFPGDVCGRCFTTKADATPIDVEKMRKNLGLDKDSAKTAGLRCPNCGSRDTVLEGTEYVCENCGRMFPPHFSEETMVAKKAQQMCPQCGDDMDGGSCGCGYTMSRAASGEMPGTGRFCNICGTTVPLGGQHNTTLHNENDQRRQQDKALNINFPKEPNMMQPPKAPMGLVNKPFKSPFQAVKDNLSDYCDEGNHKECPFGDCTCPHHKASIPSVEELENQVKEIQAACNNVDVSPKVKND